MTMMMITPLRPVPVKDPWLSTWNANARRAELRERLGLEPSYTTPSTKQPAQA